MRRLSLISLLLALSVTSIRVSAQLSPAATWAAHADSTYQIAPNLTYLTASNYD
jgi:hypothetical protein